MEGRERSREDHGKEGREKILEDHGKEGQFDHPEDLPEDHLVGFARAQAGRARGDLWMSLQNRALPPASCAPCVLLS